MTNSLRLLAASALLAFSLPAHAETFTLTFVQTNDIDRMGAVGDRGGFAKLAAVVKAERARGNPVFFVHSGDTISPSLLSGIDQGAHIIDILNKMDVDVMVPGNHEFDLGPDVFRQRISEATFPIVSSNIVMPEGGGPQNTTTDLLVEVNDIKVGFYGLTTEDTATASQPGDITFTDSLETGLDAKEDLKSQGADLVVAVVHTPLTTDMALVRANAADIILSGHDEHLGTFFDGKTVLTESYSQGDWVVITDVTVNREEKDGNVTVRWEPSFRIVDTRTVEPDAEIAALVKSYEDKLDAELNVVIGTTETPLDSRRATVRGGESAIGNLIADAMRAAVNADVAITNGGGIRADREYAAGTEVTRKDVFAELPFGNRTTKVEVTGAHLRAALENGVSQIENAGGRFPQTSGITMTVDPYKPAGSRITEIKIGDAPLDENATYIVATNDFLINGGDGYGALSEGKVLIAPADGKLMASDVIDYITSAKTISPKVEGRTVISQ